MPIGHEPGDDLFRDRDRVVVAALVIGQKAVQRHEMEREEEKILIGQVAIGRHGGVNLLLQRAFARQGFGHHRPETIVGLHEQRERQFILALVVPVECAFRHAGLFGDLAGRGGVNAFMNEQFEGGTLDLRPGVSGARARFRRIGA